jgi:hypothetical protein
MRNLTLLATLIAISISSEASANKLCKTDTNPETYSKNFHIKASDTVINGQNIQHLIDTNNSPRKATVCVCQGDPTALRFDFELVNANGGRSKLLGQMVPSANCATFRPIVSVSVRVNQGAKIDSYGSILERFRS